MNAPLKKYTIRPTAKLKLYYQIPQSDQNIKKVGCFPSVYAHINLYGKNMKKYMYLQRMAKSKRYKNKNLRNSSPIEIGFAEWK